MAAGIYVRISKADKRNGSVSNSIENQLMLINNFLEMMELNNEEKIIFKDDGYSGRNGKRPAFRRLLSKMYSGEVDLVIVKDFSRLSRDHILVSQIRQIMCPELGVRLVSIGDGYDSSISEQNDLSLAFRSLFDEYYCFDVSKKVKSALAARKEEGRYAVARLPFGYRYNDYGEVIINENEADIIKTIFNMAADGDDNRKITDYLNEKYNKGYQITFVWRILNNPMYAGYHVWHKYENDYRKYSSKKLLPKEQWRYARDDSVSIIDEETWDKVRLVRGEGKKGSSKGKRHIFHGITKCGNCGRALVRAKKRNDMLVCRNCSGCEEERIIIDDLYKILNIIINDKCGKKYIVDEKYKEVFIHTLVKRINVDNRGEIRIYWNFRK